MAITLDFTITWLKLAMVPVKDTNNMFESRSQDSLGNEQERILGTIQAAICFYMLNWRQLKKLARADFHFSLMRFVVPTQFQVRRNVKIAQ